MHPGGADDLGCTGAKLTIDTFDGEQSVHIEPGTQAGTTTILPGLGVGRLHCGGRGDLKVQIQVVTYSLDAAPARAPGRLCGGTRRGDLLAGGLHHLGIRAVLGSCSADDDTACLYRS